MRTINSAQVGEAFEKFMIEASSNHEPIQIICKKKGANGILISEDDWRAICETLYLLSIPRMRESIRNGLKTPINKTSDKLEW